MLIQDAERGRCFLRCFLAAVFFLTSGCAYQIVQPINERILGKEYWLNSEGRYAELEQYMEEKTKDQAAVKPMDLYLLCTAYGKVKRYDKFFSCLERIDKSRGGVMYGITLPPAAGSAFAAYLRAEALIDFGDYPQALREATRAVQMFKAAREMMRGGGTGDDMTLNPLAVLGLSQALNGEKEEAQKTAAALEGLKLSSLSKSQPALRAIAVAKIYMALGEYEKALQTIQRSETSGALKNLEYLGNLLAGMGWGVGSSRFSNSFELPQYFMKCKLLMETGNLQGAKEGYDLLLKVPVIEENGGLYWVILYDRGRIAEKEGDGKGAIAYYRRAIDVIEKQRSSINTEASKIGFVGDKQSVYHRLIAVLYNDRQYVSAFEYLERSKSRALVDLLATQKDFSVRTGNESRVRELLAMSGKEEMEALAQDALPETSRTRGIMIKTKEQLQEASPELASLLTVTPFTVSEIQRLLPEDEALIEYYYDDQDLYIFILTRGEMQSTRLNGKNLEQEVRGLRKALAAAESSDHVEVSRRLFQKLIQPLESFLTTSKLIVVAHGVLHYLPFNALHDGESHLIKRYSIRVLPSAGVMKYLRTQSTTAPADMLVFGNPDLGDPRYDLAYAQNEALAVAQTRPQARVLLRKEATETAFKKFASSYKAFHFATHGQFDPERPRKSALMLAGDGENDGVLSVDKLYSMTLDADLVTLSACETGLGKVANGDDVVGLTRGFLYAGSRSIVASLWKVDDMATSHLMTSFYSALLTMNKREALRHAQLETMKKYPHPFYWASFQLTGNAE
jgi:CHAT domain-containing protein